MTIRIGIDGRAMGGNIRDGISNVSCNYFLHFPQVSDVEFVVFSPHQRLFPEIERCRPYELVGASKFRKGWFYTKLPLLLQECSVDLFWSPLQVLPFGIPKRVKTVVTIHDFAYLKYPATMPVLRRWNLNFLAKHTVKKADLLVAISKTTAEDLATYYGGLEKTVVIYNGVDQEIFYPEDKFSPELRSKGLESGKYFLIVGSLEPRKNLKTLLEASVLFLKEMPVVDRPKFVYVYGNSWKAREWEKRIEKGILRHGDVLLMKGISVEILRELYSHALALVFPSLYEGFGLPVIEAMACGCPVIASDIPVIREICRGKCLLVEPNNAIGFYDALKKHWRNRNEGVKKKESTINCLYDFDWKRNSSKLLSYCLDLLQDMKSCGVFL